MGENLEFISPSDQPALVGLSNFEWMAAVNEGLGDLGYKVVNAAEHDDFLNKFYRLHYRVVVLDSLFAANTPEENLSLITLQRMQMHQRRHAVFFLMGLEFETMNPMQAFQCSVHAVINPAELPSLKPIIQQVVADNDLFLQVYRDTMMQITAWGK